MKKGLTLATALILIASAGIAQFEYGINVGLNGARISGDSPTGFSYLDKMGGTFSLVLNYRIKPDVRLSFQPGFAMNRPVLGVRDKSVDPVVVRDSIDLNLDYIKLPIFLDVLSDNRKWHYMAGVDLQVSPKQTATIIDTGEDIEIDELLRNFNPVIVFGLGRRIFIGKAKTYIDLRFGQGILNVSDTRNDETSLIPRIKTTNVELLIGIEFNAKD